MTVSENQSKLDQVNTTLPQNIHHIEFSDGPAPAVRFEHNLVDHFHAKLQRFRAIVVDTLVTSTLVAD